MIPANNKPARDWVTVLLAILIMIIHIGVLWSAYLVVLEDNPPVTINEIYPVRETGFPGGTVTYFIDVCKHTSTSPDKRVSWENSLAFVVPDPIDPPSADPGCFEFTSIIDVPETLPPSEYMLNMTWDYQVNPLAKRAVSAKIGPFTILDPEE